MGRGTDEVMRYPITMGDAVAFNYVLRHSDAHRWYYYPKMSTKELLLFKTFAANDYDGGPGGDPFVLFHSAFDLPSSSHGAERAGADEAPPPPRESLEVRCVVVW